MTGDDLPQTAPLEVFHMFGGCAASQNNQNQGCTINWFREWPAEALYSVAKQQLTMNQALTSTKAVSCILLKRVIAKYPHPILL